MHRKRGLVSAFGSIFKALLGVMDNDDEDYFQDTIQRANSRKAELAQMIKEPRWSCSQF